MTDGAAAPLLVSCIMPSANRRRYVPSAIAQFLAQDYPAAELVILDDGEDGVGDLVPSHPAPRYLRTPRHHTLGAKRNAACEAARGDSQIEAVSTNGTEPDGPVRWRQRRRLLCEGFR